jgi:hypothetical protein
MAGLDRHTFRLLSFAWFVFWTLLFSLAYTQAPLYTSNQNQYFLHGLAAAGYGYLQEDWLVSTLDPTPVFSFLVRVTYQLLHFEPVYYLYYALLMGVYLYALAGIVGQVFPALRQGKGRLLLLVLLVVLHSAMLRFGLSRLLGDNWNFLLEDGVADQRMLGLVFQPSSFGVFLMLSLYLFLCRRPRLALLSAVAAATFHPTYILAAGVLTLAYLVVLLFEGWRTRGPRSTLVECLGLGIFALLLILPIMGYVYFGFQGSATALAGQARQVLVEYRIPHHALLSWWFDLTAVFKLAFILLALYLVRKHRLFPVFCIVFFTALGLTLVQLVTRSYSLALLFPWRLSTLLVPLSTGLILGWLAARLLSWKGGGADLVSRWAPRAAWALVALAAGVGILRMALDFQRQQAQPYLPMTGWVARAHRHGQVYLTPVKLQEFRLAAGSPAYVDFKSIPYGDLDVLEWYRRVRLADRFYKDLDCQLLEQFASQEAVTHLVLPQDGRPFRCSRATSIYQDAAYGVYLLQAH